ncbi:MAG: DUF4112 domain-containing protein [Planctomycetota bacterium]
MASGEVTERAVRDAGRIARLMDTRFRVPGTEFRFGYDAIIGIVPGIGDTLTTVLGLVPVLAAIRGKAPLGVVVRMVWNLFIDWLLGLIPIVGFVLDSTYKAHTKNATLLKDWVSRRAATTLAL